MTNTASLSAPQNLLAARLKQQHAGQIALVVDLSAIMNIHDRIMFRSVARFIEERTLDEPIEIVSLARNIVVLLAPPDAARRIRQRLDALNTFFLEHRYGSLSVTEFDMESQSQQFVRKSQKLMEQAPAPKSDRLIPIRDEPPPDEFALSRIIDMHRVLWQADLSNQRRRQRIWRLVPNMVPSVLAEEVWISISAIERATGTTFRHDIWLFGKATELLDQRLIAQLAADTASMAHPLSLNLHLTSIIGSAFRRLVAEKPAAQVETLMIEVPLPEWRANDTLSAAVLTLLRQNRIRLCLDALRPADLATLRESDWEAAAFLKLDAAGHAAEDLVAAIRALPPGRQAALAAQGIFCHCDSGLAVEAGLQAGIRYFQGRGLAPLLEDPETLGRLLGPEAAEGAVAALKGL